MAPIETLPAPLPLYIVKLLPDLKSLDALRRASPLFSTIFLRHAAEILEQIMSETLLDDVIVEIRAFILLVTEEHKPQNEYELACLYIRAQEALSWTMPAPAISQILRKFTLAHSLSQIIFKTKLDLLYSLPHEHLEDKLFGYSYTTDPPHHETGSPYQVGSPSPPSWIEEQRLLRSIWRLYIFRAVDSPDYFPFLQRTNETQENWQTDEMEDVMESLSSLHDTSVVSDQIISLSWEAPAAVPASRPSTGPILTHWTLGLEDSIRAAKHKPSGYGFFHGPCLRMHRSPLRRADWRVFRRLGLGIWDDRRMATELELRSSSDPVRSSPDSEGNTNLLRLCSRFSTDDMFFTWKILYQEAASRWGWP